MHRTQVLPARRLRWSRWLVLALLALCLPLQGVLAVTMQLTMQVAASQAVAAAPAVQTPHAVTAPSPHHGHHDLHAARDADASHDAHDAHAAHASAAVHAHHAGLLVAGDGHGTPPSLTAHAPFSHGSDDGHGSDHHGCSFCAQCCIGVALLAAPLTVAASLPAAAPAPATPAAVLERQPQALDRPPKALVS